MGKDGKGWDRGSVGVANKCKQRHGERGKRGPYHMRDHFHVTDGTDVGGQNGPKGWARGLRSSVNAELRFPVR